LYLQFPLDAADILAKQNAEIILQGGASTWAFSLPIASPVLRSYAFLALTFTTAAFGAEAA